jgi:hypothetical protein
MNLIPADTTIEAARKQYEILSNLKWARNSQSEQQFRDALGITVTQGKNLEIDYLHRWTKQLQLKSFLEQLLEQA